MPIWWEIIVTVVRGLFPLFNPVALGIIIVSSVLLLFDVQYERYFDGAKFIHFLLGPATVALAIPIYRKWDLIRQSQQGDPDDGLLGSCFAILTTYALALASFSGWNATSC